ncbi:MAG TPA: MFS transporter [Pseudonocardiaceae bacterium]|jgi:MFS family permease|nr:MFS transporter [Pseudonocardiaceae bacterium]
MSESPVVTTRRNFWTAAYALTLALWASSAPSIIYPLYGARWHLSTVVTTSIFAVYPLVLVVMLMIFGNVSDRIGRRGAILLGLGFLLIGTVAFAVAPSVPLVFVGRVLQGIGVGLVIGSAGAALVDYNPYSARIPGPLNSATQSAGMTFALLVGSLLVQFGPNPLHLSYWVLAAALLAGGVLTWLLPRHNPDAVEARGPWRPQGLRVPRGLGRVYAIAGVSVCTGFGVGAVFLSMGADVAQDVLGSSNVLVNGLTLCFSTALVTLGAWIASRVGTRRSIAAGSALAILGLVALVGAALSHTLILFVVACVCTGPSVGLVMAGGVGLASASAHPRHRAQLISAVFLVGYTVQGGVALAGGVIATTSGLTLAIVWVAVVMSLFGVAAIVLAISARGVTAPSTVAEGAAEPTRSLSAG